MHWSEPVSPWPVMDEFDICPNCFGELTRSTPVITSLS